MTEEQLFSPAFINWITELKMSKRAMVARDLILEKGYTTTEELEKNYGLKHAPRAIRDLRDSGALVKTESVLIDGKRRARYTFVEEINPIDSRPRQAIPKRVKDALIEDEGPVCAACGGVFNSAELQVDHRIPFAIDGDPLEWSPKTVMLLCKSDNRAKSWTCEHCPNWEEKRKEMCESCYWAHPDGVYLQIAGEPQRRVCIVWQGEEEVNQFELIEENASHLEENLQEYIKRQLGYRDDLGGGSIE